ncbi:MAG: divergent polysaccharide deacetylase family protein [Treponema sp.]|nr:divergent polysaccharide deacetylase family protein [Treponema sp.]
MFLKQKNRTSGKKNRRKSRKAGGKRKPKVSLNGKSVVFLALSIVALSVLFLVINIIFSNSQKNPVKESEGQKTELTEKIPPVPQIPAETKSETKVEKSAAEKKTETKVEKSVAETKTETKVEKSPVEKKTETKVEKSPVENKTETKAEKSPAETKTGTKPQEPAVEKYRIPPAAGKAILVFVIDDGGRNVENVRKYANLPFAISIAVLPKLPHTKDCAYVVRSAGKELILHQPMQALNLNIDPGPGAIKAGMTTYEIAAVVKENLEELGYGVKGMNNHEGSLITSDIIKIGAVLEVCEEKGIYFLDSRTTAETKAPQAALERGIEIFEKNAPYIDNVVTRDDMLKEIYACLEVANKQGKAIMIGHVDKSAAILPDLLNDMYPYLKEKGYTFASPSMLR